MRECNPRVESNRGSHPESIGVKDLGEPISCEVDHETFIASGLRVSEPPSGMAASDDAEDNSVVLGKRSGAQHAINDRASMFKRAPVRYTENPRMICRIWHGYTTHENAGAYERVVRTIVIPGIEERSIPGFLSIDLIKRQLEHEVEFITLMWFDSPEAIVAFVGEDVTISHVPPEAREVLVRFDDRSQHYAVIDHREQ